MKNYNSYMNRQEVSQTVHENLLNLKASKVRFRPAWAAYGALAACAALIVGVAVWRLPPAAVTAPAQSGSQTAPDSASTPEAPPLPAGISVQGDWEAGFVVSSPVEEGPMAFYRMPSILYPDRTGSPDLALSRAYAPGSFPVELAKEDVQAILWGSGGKPEDTDLDLPWALFWDGYFLHGSAWYDGQGQLIELTLYGEKDRAGFELELRPGALPFTCCVDLNRGDKISEFHGVEVAGWSKAYDMDGDGQTDYICGSEFMTENNIGVRFTSWNSGGVEDGVSGEAWFNTLFVRQALVNDGGLYLDHLAATEDIPAWREEEFSTLAQARQEEDFAPYLPASEPEGYSSYTGNKEFYGRLSYQEGRQNMLFVRWSRGYDNVEVCVFRDGHQSYNLVDPDNPASYDLRLYEIPWCDSVPEEYRETVNSPAFRAEDMSLAIVEARGREHDTGGMSWSFDVLHPDGTLASYRCDGMTARQVWAMVEESL